MYTCLFNVYLITLLTYLLTYICDFIFASTEASILRRTRVTAVGVMRRRIQNIFSDYSTYAENTIRTIT